MALGRFYRLKMVFSLMAIWAFVLGVNPGCVFAMPAGSESGIDIASSRQKDIDTISRLLEADMVKAKLRKLGLSEDEVKSRIAGLSDGELHALAVRVDRVRAGGDAGGLALAILLIVLIIIAILYFTDHAIKIEKKRTSQE